MGSSQQVSWWCCQSWPIQPVPIALCSRWYHRDLQTHEICGKSSNNLCSSSSRTTQILNPSPRWEKIPVWTTKESDSKRKGHGSGRSCRCTNKEFTIHALLVEKVFEIPKCELNSKGWVHSYSWGLRRPWQVRLLAFQVPRANSDERMKEQGLNQKLFLRSKIITNLIEGLFKTRSCDEIKDLWVRRIIWVI